MSNNQYRRWVLLVGISCWLFSGCKKNDVDLSAIQNLNGNNITVLGHGGMGIASQYPLNSYESIISAVSLGAEGVEVDVQMTKDSVLVLFHNQRLDEATNLEGRVQDKTWSEIQKGIYTNPPFATYRIISLDQLFENMENKKELWLSLDFKLHEGNDEEAFILRYWNALIRVVEAHDMADRIFVEAKRKTYLEKLKMLRPNWKLFFLGSYDDGFDWAVTNDLYGLSISKNNISKTQVQAAHNAGLRVMLFGLISKNDNLEAIELSPDYLQTDKVKYLVNLFD